MLAPLQGVGPVPEQYVAPLVRAATTVAVFLVAFAALYLLGRPLATRAVERALRQRGYQETLVGLATSATAAVVAVLAVALAATVAGFGVMLAAFATLAGALALAVGFAARDLVANVVAGVFIVRDEPFAVGDWIEWNGSEGVVRSIHLRVTKLDTFDNQLVTVPNSQLAGAAVTNNVANDERRVSVDVGVGYDDDVEAARAAILEAGAAVDGVLAEPAPSAPVVELGDSAVVLSGRVWIDPAEHGYGAVRAEFLEAVKGRLDAEGIDMPYPTTALSGGVEVREVAGSAGASGG